MPRVDGTIFQMVSANADLLKKIDPPKLGKFNKRTCLTRNVYGISISSLMFKVIITDMQGFLFFLFSCGYILNQQIFVREARNVSNFANVLPFWIYAEEETLEKNGKCAYYVCNLAAYINVLLFQRNKKNCLLWISKLWERIFHNWPQTPVCELYVCVYDITPEKEKKS